MSDTIPTTTPKQRLYVTWDNFHNLAVGLANKLQESNEDKFRCIVTITRGGLTLSSILAQQLNIRLIDTVGVVTYQEFEHQTPSIIKQPAAGTLGEHSRGVLVVDDLVDTGVTIATIRELMPHATYASVYAKPRGKEQVDFFVQEISQSTWIDFPWETDP